MKLKKVITILFLLTCIIIPPALSANESINYSAHVENIGWQDPVSDGKVAGTTGEALQMEAIKINLENVSDGSHVDYASHVADIGWQEPNVQDGAVSGTTGEAKQLEAIKINLSGPVSEEYDVYYRTHVEDLGWLGWAKNGEEAGSTGLAKQMEAIEIKLVTKGARAPGSTDRALVVPTGISYQAHVENIGWQGQASNGITAGTIDQHLQVEAIRAELLNIPGNVEYNTYVQNLGWMTPTANGQDSGTTGRHLHVEGMNLVLSGEAANAYDIYYRSNVQDLGWLGWACNGDPSGSFNGNKAVQAFEIILVEKGGAAPGDTSNSWVDLTNSNKPTAAQPGLRTVKNFLATALEPIGNTLYVYGGGWNTPDTGAGDGALHIGLYPNWKPFFDMHDASYDYNTTKFQIHNGLDCSGFVGWTVYNILNTTDRTENNSEGTGEVYLADRQARKYAEKGYGTYTEYQQVRNFLPGDVVSLNNDAHVYIVIGQCTDGSVVLAHSSPPGVMISGTRGPNGEQTQATQLSHTYMQRYYPEYYARYSNKLDRNYSPYISRSSKMTWGDNFVGDPDGIRNHPAPEVLKILFNE